MSSPGKGGGGSRPASQRPRCRACMVSATPQRFDLGPLESSRPPVMLMLFSQNLRAPGSGEGEKTTIEEAEDSCTHLRYSLAG